MNKQTNEYFKKYSCQKCDIFLGELVSFDPDKKWAELPRENFDCPVCSGKGKDKVTGYRPSSYKNTKDILRTKVFHGYFNINEGKYISTQTEEKEIAARKGFYIMNGTEAAQEQAHKKKLAVQAQKQKFEHGLKEALCRGLRERGH